MQIYFKIYNLIWKTKIYKDWEIWFQNKKIFEEKLKFCSKIKNFRIQVISHKVFKKNIKFLLIWYFVKKFYERNLKLYQIIRNLIELSEISYKN